MKKTLVIMLCLALTLGITFAFAENADAGFVITMEGNPTTGYEWTYALSEEGVVEVVDEFFTLGGDEEAVGVGGVYTFSIKGFKPGTTDIMLVYAQGWDAGSAVCHANYSLTVNEDLSVICTAGYVAPQ